MLTNLFLFTVAIIAGAMNGVAGGGGLIAFPALMFVGISPIPANATNTAAMWVGTAASTFAYRQDMTIRRWEFFTLTVASVLGGTIGSYILLNTPSKSFAGLIPYLMLTATLLFAFGKRINSWLQNRFKLPMWLVIIFQFLIAIYGGFFGGGGGIVILAILEMMGIKSIHTMNAVKSWLATTLNACALLYFMKAGIIIWSSAILMAVGALIGGYGSAFFARKVSSVWVRNFITCIGVSITSYFFLFPAK
ncbi:hypothetical protein NIES2101_05265 [Calothrix sp. HK-06]|nr:hypothetical protein NIES2101_05265 [Calothrix sp. HK-06]